MNAGSTILYGNRLEYHAHTSLSLCSRKRNYWLNKDIDIAARRKDLNIINKHFTGHAHLLEGVNASLIAFLPKLRESRDKESIKTGSGTARLAQICRKVPPFRPETLDEAINAIWIIWVAIHQENTNTGLSLEKRPVVTTLL